MKTFFNYFLRGLLFIFPIFATFYVVLQLINWIDNAFSSLFDQWLPINIPGLGVVTALIAIALLGFIVSRAISRPLFTYFDQLLARIPLVKIIYTALKDFIEAFVGDKKKFNRPVIVTLTDGIDRLGFITEKDLSFLGLPDRVAVYCPHSYNFSGNLFLVEPSRIKPVNINPADAMKFAVSAGVTQIEQTAE
ncbi:DUF502 domain-containing protein [Rhodohalobacter mucosus]|uniref:DUF502 domain-containing protein n=1 Tax=Rhodohalobacter mucosus TaxID=2079485 RepID=A0A316TV06_9BACT|nr:DUF502 domain-containing protein [Rhodohalobacter mucosus]PWN06935.1 hypothetical protein DDZ15_06585 [Rhodohalobacter mucosus]